MRVDGQPVVVSRCTDTISPTKTKNPGSDPPSGISLLLDAAAPILLLVSNRTLAMVLEAPLSRTILKVSSESEVHLPA